MLLAFDIGNSDITMGLWREGTWQVWRIPSRTDQPELFYGIKVRDYFLESALATDTVETIVVSSVVPGLTDKLKNVVRSLFKREPIILGPGVYEKLPIEVLNPYEIGSDLVANATAAYFKFKQTCIVVDFGTALTFTTVSGTGKIIGVSIVPGLRTALRALSQNTAKLFDVPLEMPKSSLGINTVTAIQSGIVIGYEGLVKHMVQTIRHELQTESPAIATGGLSFVITSLKPFFQVVDPQLTLDGLRIIGELMKNGQRS
ncbi:MAG: type III pantothenate kinase [Cyclobacteriaceae bacterium]|nr:type III pantothenate kinase [Cyclobacteriaceae bacterium]